MLLNPGCILRLSQLNDVVQRLGPVPEVAERLALEAVLLLPHSESDQGSAYFSTCFSHFWPGKGGFLW